jgi:hypothetical protein
MDWGSFNWDDAQRCFGIQERSGSVPAQRESSIPPPVSRRHSVHPPLDDKSAPAPAPETPPGESPTTVPKTDRDLSLGAETDIYGDR